jgi:acyl-CoA thioester hydrolase
MRLHIPVPVRWADLDAYGHVNNVAVFGLLEEARIAEFWRHPEAAEPAWPTAVLDAGPGAATVTVVARQEIEYLLPIDHRREPVTVETWLGSLGGASIGVCYEITAPVDGERRVFVQAVTTLVLLDAATGRPRRITEDERAVWQRYVGPAVAWRRRGN